MDVQEAREKHTHRNAAVWLPMRGFKKQFKKEGNFVIFLNSEQSRKYRSETLIIFIITRVPHRTTKKLGILWKTP